MKKVFALLVFVFSVSVLPQGTPPTVRSDIAKLGPTTRLEWSRNPEPDVAGYWVHMQTGTNFVQFYTTNNFVPIFTLNPNTPNGTHQFAVYAVNLVGQESDASPTLTTNLWRSPGQASKPKVYTP